ncbi:hypothetical protein ABZ847_29470 [Streptomyces bauhiniae]
MTDLYTDTDVTLVADAFVTTAKKNPVSLTTPPWAGVQTRLTLGPTERDIARAVLDALAAAGRLAPTGPCPCTCHRPDDCPCGPLTPTHRHGAGQHCTVARDGTGHVLAVAADGTWQIHHPAGCTVHTRTGPVVICIVGDLAAEQLPTGIPAGRYGIEANDIGDRLLIGDRLDPTPAADREG